MLSSLIRRQEIQAQPEERFHIGSSPRFYCVSMQAAGLCVRIVSPTTTLATRASLWEE